MDSESASIQSVNSASENYSDDDYDDESMGKQTIVIDNGSETLKIGYSSQSTNSHRPTKKFHSIIGRPRNQQNNHSTHNQDLYIADDAYNKSSILSISNVIQRGKVSDWNSMEM